MVPPEVATYVADLSVRLRDLLGRDLTGVYLHGSAAMSGWEPLRSDVDLLVVVGRPLTGGEKAATGQLLAETPCPGVGIEYSVVVVPRGPVSPRPAFELHGTSGRQAKIVDGAGHPGDSDLVMHYAVCRERGIAIVGPPPREVFPAVPRTMLLEAFADEVVWGLTNAPLHYAALNACRAWAFAEAGSLLSKVEGADWALERGVEPGTARAALAAQRGEAAELRRESVERLVARAREALAAAAVVAGDGGPRSR